MAGQSWVYVYKITLSTGGAPVFACANDPDIWEEAVHQALLGSTWVTLRRWNLNASWRAEMDDNRMVEVNMAYVAAVEKWRELR